MHCYIKVISKTAAIAVTVKTNPAIADGVPARRRAGRPKKRAGRPAGSGPGGAGADSTADLAREIAERLQERADAQDPAHWTPHRLAGLRGGSALGARGVGRLVRLLVDDVPRFFPVIEGLLGEAVRDSDEFAETLVILKRAAGYAETIPGTLARAGASDPETALRLARRLLKLDDPAYADLLIAGAAPKLPGECEALVRELFASGDARIVVAVNCRIRAHSESADCVEAGVFEELERASESEDPRVRRACLDAFVTFYASDRQRCLSAIERLAGSHPWCAQKLAQRIRRRSPFDGATALRLLGVCSEFHSHQTGPDVEMAVADLAGGHLAEAMQIAIKYAVRLERVKDFLLGRIGEAHGAKSVEMLLSEAVKSRILGFCAPAMAKCLIDSAGKDALGPVFEAIRSGPDPCAIGLRTLREVISDRSAGCESHAPVLRAIEDFLKSLAESRGIDAGRAARGGGDQVRRCARLIDAALNSSLPDYDLARKNMCRFPTLLDLFGRQWIDGEERRGGTHPLLCGLGQELPSEEEASALMKAEAGETAEQLIRSLDRRRLALGAWRPLDWLDRSLREIREAGHDAARLAKRLKSKDGFFPAVSEVRLAVQFLGRCEMEMEPSVGSKRPDLRLEILGRTVYVEVISPEMHEDLRLLSGGRGVPNRAPGKMLDKARGQLRELDGRGHPAILAIDIGGSEILPESVEDCLRGPGTLQILFRNGEAEECWTGRDAGKNLHGRDPDTDVISAVVWYRMQTLWDLTERMEFGIIPNLHARVELDAPTIEFLKECLSGRRARSERRIGGGRGGSRGADLRSGRTGGAPPRASNPRQPGALRRTGDAACAKSESGRL